MQPVSILMKVWNASRYVKLCLETLLADSSSPFELIIIDNGSKPRLKEYLLRKQGEDQRIRLIENTRNLGPGYANRQGFEAASYPLVCLLDSDVLLPRGWLARLLNDFNEHPGLKMLSPMQHEEAILYPFEGLVKDSRQAWYDIESRYAGELPQQQFLYYSHGLSLEAFEVEMLRANMGGIQFLEAPPDFLSSCCCLVDGDFAAQAGGIADPDFRGYGSEDVDLCWRISRAGGLSAKTCSVYVHHFQGASLEDNQVDRLAALKQANQILYYKWKAILLDLVARKKRQEGVDLIQYLESHFIFPALARHTSFIEDLRLALDDPTVPDDLVWRH